MFSVLIYFGDRTASSCFDHSTRLLFSACFQVLYLIVARFRCKWLATMFSSSLKKNVDADKIMLLVCGSRLEIGEASSNGTKTRSLVMGLNDNNSGNVALPVP